MNIPMVTVESIAATEKYSLIGGPFGSKLTSKDYVSEGVPVIRGANMGQRYILNENFAFVTESKVNKDLFGNLAYPSDLVFTQRGTLGQVSMIPDDSEYSTYVISQSQMKLTIDKTKADRKYVYYYFSSNEARKKITNLASSSGVPHINLTTLRNFRIPLPNLSIQKSISAQLSAYDDLIENNKRRISLLEESARHLYKEWFVRFRFPGHEHVKIVDGVPEGWDRVQVGDLLTLQRGFDLPLKARQIGEIPIYASTGINGYHNEHKVEGPGIVTGRSGSLGSVMFISGKFWPLNTTLWVKEFKKVTPYYALFFLRQLKLENYNGGAAVPTLNRNDVHRIETFSPPASLMGYFSDFVSPLFQQIVALVNQNKKLTNARDLLLPKLMNGEVAV